MSIETDLKKHSEALVKDVGIEAACALTGRSRATALQEILLAMKLNLEDEVS